MEAEWVCGRSRSASGAAAASLDGPFGRFDGPASALPAGLALRFFGTKDALAIRDDDAVSLAARVFWAGCLLNMGATAWVGFGFGSVEVDPRTVTRDRLAHLAALGFNRLSFGVQDFDPKVQKAVHRVQPYEQVKALVADACQLDSETPKRVT